MSQLVERLLTLARLDAGVDTLGRREVDVAALAEQCAALVRPLAEARELDLAGRTAERRGAADGRPGQAARGADQPAAQRHRVQPAERAASS